MNPINSGRLRPVIYWVSFPLWPVRLSIPLWLWLSATISLSGQVCSFSTEHTDVECFGEPTGSIEITVGGGVAPYQFIWTGPGSFTSTDEDLAGLGAGTYTVTVTDAGGICNETADIVVGQPGYPMGFMIQPSDQTDCYGNTVEFSAAVNGSVGTVSYQWQSRPPEGEFTDIPGETTSDLVIHDIGVSGQNIHGTEYRLIASDNCSTIVSEPALLQINAVTGLTGSVNLTICSGSGTSYEVSTRGDVTGYRWSFNDGTGWQPINDGSHYSGTDSQRLTISDATPAQTGAYRVTVTFLTLNQPEAYPECVITTHTRDRNLIVLPPLLPPVVSSDQTICYNTMPSPLSATEASGGSGSVYSYQWQISFDNDSWTDIYGANVLTYSPSLQETTTWYRISVTDEGPLRCGTTFSIPVAVVVNPLPVTSPIYHN
ncbi:MAG: SprB repeat-containing protein [Bacteroidales bacterium]|nr:SprB repeat-containing protein [Bacteroidales bacterium]